MEFEWDEDNLDHLRRHRISADEAEEVFEGTVLRQRGGSQATDRFRVLGRTAAGRYLVILYQSKGSIIRPYTGWDMSRSERLLYERQTRS